MIMTGLTDEQKSAAMDWMNAQASFVTARVLLARATEQLVAVAATNNECLKHFADRQNREQETREKMIAIIPDIHDRLQRDVRDGILLPDLSPVGLPSAGQDGRE